MDESLEKLLADLVVTSNNTSTFDEALSYFPEFKNVDSKLLADFVATAQDVGDIREAISYFPEFGGDKNITDTEPEKKLVAEIVPEPEGELVDMQGFDDRKLYSTRDLAMENGDDPNIIQDYLSGPLKFTAGLFKGIGDLKNMSNMLLMDAGLRIFSDVNDEQRQALVAAEGRKGDIQNFVWGEIEKSLDKYQKKYENESFLDDWEQGNKGLAVERAVGAAIESIPTTLAAFTGLGGIIALGGSFAGSKFREEYTKDPSRSIYRLAGNALLSGGTESAFEGVTRYLGGKVGLIAVKKGGQAAKEFTKSF